MAQAKQEGRTERSQGRKTCGSRAQLPPSDLGKEFMILGILTSTAHAFVHNKVATMTIMSGMVLRRGYRGANSRRTFGTRSSKRRGVPAQATVLEETSGVKTR